VRSSSPAYPSFQAVLTTLLLRRPSATSSTNFTSSIRLLEKPSRLTNSTRVSFPLVLPDHPFRRYSPSFVAFSTPSSRDELTLCLLTAYQALSTFSNSTLSSLYFDVTKDSLYADSKSSLGRRQIVHVLQKVRFYTLGCFFSELIFPLQNRFTTPTSRFSPLSLLCSPKRSTTSPLERRLTRRRVRRDHRSSRRFGLKRCVLLFPLVNYRRKLTISRLVRLQDSRWKNLEVKADMNELLAVRAEVNSLLEQARTDKFALFPIFLCSSANKDSLAGKSVARRRRSLSSASPAPFSRSIVRPFLSSSFPHNLLTLIPHSLVA
jgi:hypothetical protein